MEKACRRAEKEDKEAKRAMRRAQRRLLSAEVTSTPPLAVVSCPGSSCPSPTASAHHPSKRSVNQPYLCGTCNSMDHWTRLRPSLPESVRAEIARVQAQRDASRPSGRPKGVAAAVVTAPAGTEAEACSTPAQEEHSSGSTTPSSGPSSGNEERAGSHRIPPRCLWHPRGQVKSYAARTRPIRSS